MEETGEDGADRPANPLASFLAEANNFIGDAFANLVRSVGRSHDTALLESDLVILVDQFRRMTDKVQKDYSRANARIRPQIDEFLELQLGTMIAETERTAAAVMAKGVTEGFLVWLARNLQEIKKVIRMIARILCDGVPAWYDDVALLIDERAHMILALIATLGGLDGARVASELSKAEQNFWAEQAALDRVAALRRQAKREDKD